MDLKEDMHESNKSLVNKYTQRHVRLFDCNKLSNFWA